MSSQHPLATTLCRDGIPARKRNFEAYVTWAEERELEKTVAERRERLYNNPAVFTPFQEVPEAQAWLEHFKTDRLRYPLLLVHAPSFCGKTEWALSLFKKPLKVSVGSLTFFPAELQKLNRKVHDGLVLDDCRDLSFLDLHQEKLQGKAELVEFGSSPCNRDAYTKDMYCLPIVVTINNDTANLDYLLCKDFFSKKDNVVLLCFSGRPGLAPPATELPG